MVRRQRQYALHALGLDGVAAREPLSYPGTPAPGPGLLHRDELLPLRPRAGPVGGWQVEPLGCRLDDVLVQLELAPVADRVPVVAVGSNASPGQLRHKLTAAGLTATVPMAPVRLTGIAVGVSAHISALGYVSASPYPACGRESVLVTSWLDADQLDAVDATESVNYRRVEVPGDRFPMRLPSGEPLAGGCLYANIHGVLALDGRTPHPTAEQPALLRQLLAASGRLRRLLGPDPRSWVEQAAADPRVRSEGGRIFEEEGWRLPQPELLGLPGTAGPPGAS